MLRYILLILLTGLLLTSARAQDSTVVRLIRQHQLPLTATGTTLTGPGWEQLRQAIDKSQFVLVGEDHGWAEVPLFHRAVAEVFRPAALVAEVSPYEAQDLNSLVAQPGPPALLAEHPFALSFYSWAEEFELVRALHRQRVQLIGLDQVSLFSTGRLYRQLAERVRSKPARTYLTRRAAGIQAHDRQCYQQGMEGLGQLSMFTLPPAAIDSLLALTKAESPDTRKMAQDFALSHQIYTSGSHSLRVNLLKRNLLQAARTLQPRPDQPLPRLQFKFGANHLARGGSLLQGTFDIGNLVTNLADAQDQKSLHILLLGRQGTRNGNFFLDGAKNQVPYVADDSFVLPFAGAATGSTWSVVPLLPLRRALRAGKLHLPDEALERVVLGYDYVVVIPETTASRNF